MGMSASQARFLSVTSRINDLGLRGQAIAETRIRLAMDQEEAGRRYNRDISDRRLYLDTTKFSGGETYGKYEFISYENLLEQGLYVFDGEKILGYGEKQGVIGKEQYISSYENDLSKPLTWDKKLEVVGQTDDLTKPIAWNKKLVDDLSQPIAWNKKTVTDYDNPIAWGTKTIPGEHHPAQVTPINQTTSADCQPASRSDDAAMYDNLTSVLNTAGITNKNDAEIVKYRTAVKNSSGQYEYKEVVSLAIKNENAMKKLNASNAFNTAAGLKGNYLLLGDMNLSGANWNAIGGSSSAFTGIFDGNQHSINNMTINLAGQGNKMYQGLFGNNSGTVKGVDLNNATIILDEAKGSSSWTGYVGGIAGYNQSGGLVENCNVNNINIKINGQTEEIGAVVGRNYGKVDKVSASGNINVGGYAGDIGGLIGWHNGGTISCSSSNVNITIGGNCNYGGPFIGDANGGTFENCMNTGNISTSGSTGHYNNKGLAGNYGAGIHNSFSYQNGQYLVYDNGTTSGSAQSSSSSFQSQFKDDRGYVTINDEQVPVWLFPGESYNGVTNNGSTPILNNDAVNVVTLEAYNDPDQTVTDYDNPTDWGTKQVDDLDSPCAWNKKEVDDLNSPTAWEQKDVLDWVDDKTKPTSWAQKPVYSERDVYGPVMDMDDNVEGLTCENLEYGLRSGKLQLYKLADELSTTVKEFGAGKFQPISWETCTVISDDLYKENDAEAEVRYNNEMAKLQAKDKKLELEQKNVDTEYKALTTEQDSIKKVIDKNIETSFKMFG